MGSLPPGEYRLLLPCVQINYKDHELLHHEAVEGAQMGFEGKQVIHPGQVDIVQKVPPRPPGTGPRRDKEFGRRGERMPSYEANTGI